MDDVAAGMIDSARALADFDHARDDFEQAFSQVPPEGLDYKPEGDDYSVRDLLAHIAGSMNQYSAVLDQMKEAEFREVRMASLGSDVPVEPPSSDPGPTEQDVESNPEAGMFKEMELAHDTLAAKIRDLEAHEYSLEAPVFYPGAEEAYPTKASDIVGWVTDHYNEHTVQVLQMLEQWKSKQ